MASTNYFNYIQPTIVKLSDCENVPEHLRNHYLVNLNIVGIKYFVDNFLLMEDGNGGYMYLLTDEFHKIRLNEGIPENAIDIPRAYIVLTEEFVQSQADFSSWVLTVISDNSYFLTGTDNFKPGVDYYINQVLADYLRDNEGGVVEANLLRYVLPDYLNGNFQITSCWEILADDEAKHQNFEYFYNRNKVIDLTFSEDELKSFNRTFFNIIKEDAIVTDEDMLKTQNQIYQRVVEYYSNYQTDCALVNIGLLLNSTVTATTNQTSCNCQDNSSSALFSTSTYDLYKTAMFEWMVKMLGDVDFYKDWMYVTDVDGGLYPNVGMIESLIQLISDFLESGIDLSFAGKSIYNHCKCDGDFDALADAENRKILSNYITLLRWVLEGCIDNNTNKIKVIGEKFGNLIQKMMFV